MRATSIKILWVSGFLLVIICAVVGAMVFDHEKTADYFLEGQKYQLLVANNAKEYARGLSGRDEVKNAQGMVFYFSDLRERTFWNKNTYFDLEVYWLKNDQVVGKSELPSIQKSGKIVSVKSPESVNRVVELLK